MASKPHIMIVEDEPLVAFFVAELLEEFGFTPSDAFPTNSAAIAWLEKNRPDAAILDFGLRDGRSNRTADRLTRLGIPFLVVSGFDRHEDLGAEFGTAHWLCKPFRQKPFSDAVARLLELPTRPRGEVRQMPSVAPRASRVTSHAAIDALQRPARAG